MHTQHYRVRSGEDLGRVLRDARSARQLTQQQMVDRFELGFDRTRLARIEAGEGFQSLNRALSVLRRLGIEVYATVPEPAEPNASDDEEHDDDRHREDGGAFSWP
jgi:transcriptional regulator with XRE-family HTH domain